MSKSAWYILTAPAVMQDGAQFQFASASHPWIQYKPVLKVVHTARHTAVILIHASLSDSTQQFHKLLGQQGALLSF